MGTSGSMSGVWKRSMAWLLRHRQTKGPATARRRLTYRATPRLCSLADFAFAVEAEFANWTKSINTLRRLCAIT